MHNFGGFGQLLFFKCDVCLISICTNCCHPARLLARDPAPLLASKRHWVPCQELHGMTVMWLEKVKSILM